jgi:hypothetical protein
VVYTQKGLRKRRTRQTVRVLLAALTVVGAYHAHQRGVSIEDVRAALKNNLAVLMAQLIRAWTLARKQLPFA